MSGFRTILSALVAIAPAIANFLGFDTAPGFTEQATQLIGDAVTIGAGLLAIYFRLIATVPGWFARRP